MVNPDFLPAPTFISTDLVYAGCISWSTPAATDTPSPSPIPRDTAAITMFGSASTWVNIDGNGVAAPGAPNCINVTSNWTPPIGLELDGPVTVHQNSTGGAFLCIVLLKRRRRFPRAPGQV